MTGQTLTLADFKERALDKILQEVADRLVSVTILLPDGKEVVIEPKRRLQPLPELEGHIPEGWKDALYARG